MSINKIPVAGELIAGTVDGKVVDSKYIKAGYIVCQTIQEMNDLLPNPTYTSRDILVTGSPVYVVETNAVYRYDKNEGRFTDDSYYNKSTTDAKDAAISALINNISNSVTELERDVDNNAENISTLFTNASSLRSDLSNLSSYTSCIASNVTNLSAEVDNIGSTINISQSQVDNLPGDLNAIRANVTRNYNAIALNAQNITNVSNDLNNLSDDVGNLSGDIVNLSNDLNNLSNDADNLSANYSGLYANFGDLQSNYSNLYTNYSGLYANYSVLYTNYSTLYSNYGTLYSNVGTLQSNVSTLETGLNNVTVSITNINTNISNIDNSIGSISNSITNLQNNKQDNLVFNGAYNASTNPVATSEYVNNLVNSVVSFKYEIVSNLPDPSASTMGVMYLKKDDPSDTTYKIWVTVAQGTPPTYSWVNIGGTDIDLSGYIPTTSIVNNVTTNDATKVLSAAQGVTLKGLIDAINNWDAKNISAEDISNWDEKQDALTFDSNITADSNNIANSGVIYSFVNDTLLNYVTNTTLETTLESYIPSTSIVNDVTTNDATKVLSASQGVTLKGLIDNISVTSLGAEPAFAKNTAFNKNFGNVANTVCEGNDARLSDSRPASDVPSYVKSISETDISNWNAKQNALTFDPTITADSDNVASSGVIYSFVNGNYAKKTSLSNYVTITNLSATLHDYEKLNVAEYTGLYNISYDFDNSTNTAIVFGKYRDKSISDVIIPEYIEHNGSSYKVTSVGNRAFYDENGIDSVSLPDSLRTIGQDAFDGCTWLRSVNLGSGLETIGLGAFKGCSNLTSITIPDGVKSIDSHTFYLCSNLYNVTLGSSVGSIGNYAFCYCRNLTSITIPNSVTSIGNGAFDNCSGLTRVTIPDSVTSIDNNAFKNCSNLMSATIGRGVTSIGEYAFLDCTNLSTIYIERDAENPNMIAGAPWGAPSTTNVVYIDITDISQISNISTQVSNIASDVANLSSQVNNDTKIDGGDFRGVVISPAEYSGVTALTYTLDNSHMTATVAPNQYIPSGTTAVVIPKHIKNAGMWYTVTSLASQAFSAATGVTSITIPDSVTSIGDSAFRNCRSLTSITISDSVTSIGSYAFFGCNNLSSINIPYSVTSIGSSAFYSCTNLSGVIIPGGVASIGSEAFRQCSSLTSITIPNSVTSIGGYAFSGCSNLSSIILPDSMTSIGSYAFLGCPNLSTIYVEKEQGTLNGAPWSASHANVIYTKQQTYVTDTTSLNIGSGYKNFILTNSLPASPVNNSIYFVY